MSKPKAHVSEAKKQLVKVVVEKMKKNPIVGIANLAGLPAAQLQKMQQSLREKIDMIMTKKTVAKIIIEQVTKDKAGIEKLEEFLGGNPSFLFTKENPFSLFRTLKKNKSPAPAKAGQLAPKELVIKAGPTPFAPGPVISEFKQLGVAAGIEGGKIIVKQDSVVCKAGGVINEQLASMLSRLGIQPMEIGLDLVAVYENGVVYTKAVLDIDEDKFKSQLNRAITYARNLSVEAAFPTKQNINLLLGKAVRESKALARSQNILAKGMVEEILAKAHVQMLALKNKIQG